MEGTGYGGGDALNVLNVQQNLQPAEYKLERAKSELQAAEQKLQAAEQKLEKAKQELEKAEAKLEKAEAKLEKAEAKLEKAEKNLLADPNYKDLQQKKVWAASGVEAATENVKAATAGVTRTEGYATQCQEAVNRLINEKITSIPGQTMKKKKTKAPQALKHRSMATPNHNPSPKTTTSGMTFSVLSQPFQWLCSSLIPSTGGKVSSPKHVFVSSGEENCHSPGESLDCSSSLCHTSSSGSPNEGSAEEYREFVGGVVGCPRELSGMSLRARNPKCRGSS